MLLLVDETAPLRCCQSGSGQLLTFLRIHCYRAQVEEKEMERDQQQQRAKRDAQMERSRLAEEKRAMEAEQVSCAALPACRACTVTFWGQIY